MPRPLVRRYLALALAVAAAAAVVLATRARTPRGFDSPADFREWAQAHGMHAWPESGEWVSVLVSDRHAPAALGQVVVTPWGFPGPQRGTGIVHVTETANLVQARQVPHRVWGNVLVSGDEDLLNRLDALR